MPSPRIVHSDEVVRLATWQNVAITDVRGEMDVVRIQRLVRAVKALVAEFPNGIVTCAFIRENTPVGSKEARNEAAKFVKDLGDSCLRMALVIEERGIMAQVLRTVVRGMNVITRNTRLVLFNEPGEAVDALAPLVVSPRLGTDVAAELRAAIAAIRDGYGPRPLRRAAQR